MTTTSLWQVRDREEACEGSRRQSCEPRNTNAIEGRHLGGESAPHDKAAWFEGHGKWRGCATTVHVLIWGDLLDGRSVLSTGAGLRPGSKGPDKPPDPTAAPPARMGAIPCVFGQKSAEAIVVLRHRGTKGRTWLQDGACALFVSAMKPDRASWMRARAVEASLGGDADHGGFHRRARCREACSDSRRGSTHRLCATTRNRLGSGPACRVVWGGGVNYSPLPD